jgi:hypothetical protein
VLHESKIQQIHDRLVAALSVASEKARQAG